MCLNHNEVFWCVFFDWPRLFSSLMVSDTLSVSEAVLCVGGMKTSAFPVDMDPRQLVGALKNAIKNLNENAFKADDLKLFLAKTGDAWLESSTEGVKKLEKGENTAAIEALTHEDEELHGESGLQSVLPGMPEPPTDQIHVLVVVRTQRPSPHLRFESYRPHAEGLNSQLPHLALNALVEKLYHEVMSTSLLLLSSPPATGRTSLLTMFAALRSAVFGLRTTIQSNTPTIISCDTESVCSSTPVGYPAASSRCSCWMTASTSITIASPGLSF